MGGAAVTAGVGRAASLGVLSVPQGWTSAAPAFSQVASAMPGASRLGATPPVAPSAPTGPVRHPAGQCDRARRRQLAAGCPLQRSARNGATPGLRGLRQKRLPGASTSDQ